MSGGERGGNPEADPPANWASGADDGAAGGRGGAGGGGGGGGGGGRSEEAAVVAGVAGAAALAKALDEEEQFRIRSSSLRQVFDELSPEKEGHLTKRDLKHFLKQDCWCSLPDGTKSYLQSRFHSGKLPFDQLLRCVLPDPTLGSSSSSSSSSSAGPRSPATLATGGSLIDGLRQTLPSWRGMHLYFMDSYDWKALERKERLLCFEVGGGGGCQLWARTAKTTWDPLYSSYQWTVSEGRCVSSSSSSPSASAAGSTEYIDFEWSVQFTLDQEWGHDPSLAGHVDPVQWLKTQGLLDPSHFLLDTSKGELRCVDDGLTWHSAEEAADAEVPQLSLPQEFVDRLKHLLAEQARKDGRGNNKSSNAEGPGRPHFKLEEDLALPVQDEGVGFLDADADADAKGEPVPQYSVVKRNLTASWDEDHDSKPRAALRYYVRAIQRCPLCFIFCYTIIMVVVVAACWRPFELDTDFSAFIQADGEAQRRQSAFTLAAENRGDLDDRRLRRLSLDEGSEPRGLATMLYISLGLNFIYVAKSGNMFDERALREARDFEAKLLALPGWSALCSGSTCEPGQSVNNFAWPSQKASSTSGGRFDLDFDGGGEDPLAPALLLQYLSSLSSNGHTDADAERYFPEAYSVPSLDELIAATATAQSSAGLATNTAGVSSPPALRSIFNFEISVGENGDAMSEIKAKVNAGKTQYQLLIEDEVYPLILETQESLSYIDIYYLGDHIESYEVQRTLQRDLYWAAGSFLFVVFYTSFHTRSVIFSVLSLVVVLSSIPLAYVFTPAEKTTIASFLAIFLITGVGVDSVFVFTDFWGQGDRFSHPDTRLVYLYIQAGKSCLATSLTTAVSFLANLASVLQPLREFGLFMGLCVLCSYLLVLLYVPCFLVVGERRRSRRRVQLRTVDISTGEISTLSVVPGSCNAVAPAPTDKSAAITATTSRFKSKKQVVMFNLASWISHCPILVVLCTLLFVGLCIIGIVLKAQLDTGMPEIFRADHNQVRGSEWNEKFASESDLASWWGGEDGMTCYAEEMTVGINSACLSYWCESKEQDENLEETTSATCWHSPPTVDDSVVSLSSCSNFIVYNRIASEAAPLAATWRSTWSSMLGESLGATFDSSSTSIVELSPLVLENWDTGGVSLARFFYTTTIYSSTSNSSRLCIVRSMCFAGAGQCQVVDDEEEGWTSMGTIQGLFASDSGRRLQSDLERKGEVPLIIGRPSALDRIDQKSDSGPVVEDLKIAATASTSLSASSASSFPTSAAVRSGERRELSWRTTSRTTSQALQRRSARDSGDSTSNALGSYARILSFTPVVAAHLRLTIVVAFGILAPTSTPLVGALETQWSYDPKFQPQNPWAQRAMLAMCSDMPDSLRVTSSDCWIVNFRDYLSRSGDRFPSRDFDAKLINYHSYSAIDTQEHIWFVDRQMKACHLAFKSDVDKNSGASPMLDFKAYWDAFVDQRNAAASVTASRAFHTSSSWVQAEAEAAIVDSMEVTIILSAACSALGVFLFTGDICLMFLVIALVLGIMSGLAAFMVVLMGWTVGPIEVIALVVFVGYAVTYSLHIAHDYSRVGEDHLDLLAGQEHLAAKLGKSVEDCALLEGGRAMRVARARVALLRLGHATLSSATSTIGSGFFLLFCTLNVFVKLGAVLMAVTTISIAVALLALPAVLMLLGPPTRAKQRLFLTSLWRKFVRRSRSDSGDRGVHLLSGS